MIRLVLRSDAFSMYIISKPKPEDAEAIAEVIRKSWYATYIDAEVGITKEDIDLMYAENQAQQVDVFRERALHPKDDDISLVAKESERGKVDGFIRLKIHPDSVEMLSLYVDPECVGKGIGTSLWPEAQKTLPKDKSVMVEVASYTKAVDFYKKLGFVDQGEKYRKQGEKMLSSGNKIPLVSMVLER